MIKFLKNLFGKEISGQNKDVNRDTQDDKIIEAVAVLLLRAASIDGNKDEVEILSIKRLLKKQFDLGDDEIEILLSSATKEEEKSVDLYKWSRIINDNFSKEKKHIVFSMMCEIIIADGLIDPFESSLIRRLSGLLYISDKEAGFIRKKILETKGK
jgi:uncharacterized tellurite resistance protein B-like protein|tara:strand:- start:635 stop:1102 length:468 start_codon:yes stop_codon:yes gene_type:complete